METARRTLGNSAIRALPRRPPKRTRVPLITLPGGMGFMLLSEYTKTRTEVARTRLNAEQARDAYLRHRREHGC